MTQKNPERNGEDMKLNDVQAGDICAYVEDYASVRRESWCRTQVMDACPVKIVRKEKVPTRINKDACGRATVQTKTMLVVKRYNLKASDPLALDLDIVEDKHKELVVDEIIMAKDLVWSWEEEVRKVREDHRVNSLMSRFTDYFTGVSYQLALEGIRRYRFADKLTDRSTFRIREETYSLKEYLDDCIRERFSRPLDLKEEPSYLDMVRYMPEIRVGCEVDVGEGHIGYHGSRHFELFFGKSFFEYLFTSRGLTPKDSLSCNDVYPKNKKLGTKHWNQQKRVFKAFLQMTGEERLALLAKAIRALMKEVELSTGIDIPSFNHTKSWESWKNSQEICVDEYRNINKEN